MELQLKLSDSVYVIMINVINVNLLTLTIYCLLVCGLSSQYSQIFASVILSSLMTACHIEV